MKIGEYEQMMAYLTRPRENFAKAGSAKVDGRTTRGINVERRNVIKNILEQDIEDFNRNKKLYSDQKYPLNLDKIQKLVKEQTGTLPDAYLINESLEKLDPKIKSNITKVEKGGTTSLTPKEEKLFANNYNKKTISQMATEITGLPYDNKITKAKNAQLYRYYLTQKKLGNIEEVVKGTRPKGSTPKTEKGFEAYKKAQKDLMNLDPDTYKDLTPAQVDARLKKAIQFSKVRGAFDVPTSLTPSFEHFQGITPGTITQDPDALRKVGITTQDFNFNVLGAKAKNNIYKTIKNELRTAKEATKLGDNKTAKQSLNTVNEIYDDVAKKLKTIKRSRLPKYNLSKNLIKETNLKAVDFDVEKRLGNTIEDYVRFVAAGPKKDVSKIKQPNLKKAVQLVKKGDDQAVKNLIDSRLPSVRSGQLFSNPMADPSMLKQYGKYALQVAGTPLGAGFLTAGFGVDPTSAIDRSALAAEAALAPSLVRGAAEVATTPGMQKILNLGLSPQMAMRAARVAQPLGLLSLAGEGLYQLGKRGAAEKAKLDAMTPFQKEQYLAGEIEPLMDEGGMVDISRDGFDEGGPSDPSKRKFIKIMGGLASIPLVGKFFKPAAKFAPAVTETIQRGADAVPTFLYDLINKVKSKGMKYFTGNRADEFEYVYERDGYQVREQGNKITVRKRIDDGEMLDKDMEMELEVDPETGGMTYKEATARPDAEGKLKDVEEYIDDIDLEDMKKYTYDE